MKLLSKDGSGRSQVGFVRLRNWLDEAGEREPPDTVPAGTIGIRVLPLASRKRDQNSPGVATEVPDFQSVLRKWLMKGWMKTVFRLMFIPSVACKCCHPCPQLLWQLLRYLEAQVPMCHFMVLEKAGPNPSLQPSVCS